MYAQLKQSYQWNMLNEDGKVINKVQTLLKTGEAITFDRMPTVLSVMRNRVKSPIFNKMLEAIKEESLVLLFNKETNVKTPGFLPFVVMQNGKSYVAIVFMELCEARLGDGDEILVNERKLKVAMESAYMTLCMLDDANKGKLQSANIVRPSSKIYSYMIAECINRRHSIKMDQNVFHATIYLLSKFFICTTLGSTASDDIVENYCIGNCQNNPYPAAIHQIADNFEEKDFENIATLISKMSSVPELAPRLGKLTVSNFTESFINMYDIAMLLSLENYPYFVFNILSVVDTTYINNYYHLKNIVGDDGKKLYATLISSIC